MAPSIAGDLARLLAEVERERDELARPGDLHTADEAPRSPAGMAEEGASSVREGGASKRWSPLKMDFSAGEEAKASGAQQMLPDAAAAG